MAIEIHRLLSSNAFRKISGARENLEDSRVKVVIYRAQTDYVRPLLGNDLYNEIVEASKTDSLTAIQTTLVDDYLSHVLVLGAEARLIEEKQIEISNHGVGAAADNRQQATPSDAQLGRSVTRRLNDMEVARDSVRKFLKDNEDSFPLWDGCEKNTGNIMNGFYLG